MVYYPLRLKQGENMTDDDRRKAILGILGPDCKSEYAEELLLEQAHPQYGNIEKVLKKIEDSIILPE